MNSTDRFGVIVDPHTIRFERLMPGPRMRVWDFLTKRELLRLWLAKGAVKERVGSRVELHFDAEEAPERNEHGAIIRGTVFRCELGSVLSYSWGDGNVESVVSFELASVDAEVSLVLTHKDLPEPLTALVAAGWHTHLEALRARVDKNEPKPFLDVFQAVLPAYRKQMAALRTAKAARHMKKKAAH